MIESTFLLFCLCIYVSSALLEFILEDLRANFDLAIAWLFAEYSIAESYRQSTSKTLCYDTCLVGLLKGACEKLEPRDRSVLIVKLQYVYMYICSIKHRNIFITDSLLDLYWKPPKSLQQPWISLSHTAAMRYVVLQMCKFHVHF